jgi:hypothetical protein
MITEHGIGKGDGGKEEGKNVISGFRRNVDENCVLLGYYAASCGNCLPTFRDNVSLTSSRVQSPSRKERKTLDL